MLEADCRRRDFHDAVRAAQQRIAALRLAGNAAATYSERPSQRGK